MTDIRWKEPPPSGHPPNRPDRWAPVAAELKSHPGEWALVFEGPTNICTSVVYRIRRATLAAFRPAGTYEATSRTSGGTGCVYARYVGENGDES